ncbi:MAG: MOSC domain-containing protein [Saprospiraceae bacterium]
MAIVSSLHIYPVKGLMGYSPASAVVERRGLKYDRNWMLVDEENIFLSQREIPEMVFLQARVEQEVLWISDRKGRKKDLQLPLDNYERGSGLVEVWKDEVQADWVGKAADEWFSDLLGFKCRLVYMPGTTKRQVDLNYAQPGDITTFSDGYPVLIATESSLGDLNQRLTDGFQAEMARFRPNIVVQGTQPWEEDQWAKVRVGDAVFRTPKPCARCQVVTIDPATGEPGKEPLRTLSAFRSRANKVNFGMNACPEHSGLPVEIRLGDLVEQA